MQFPWQRRFLQRDEIVAWARANRPASRRNGALRSQTSRSSPHPPRTISHPNPAPRSNWRTCLQVIARREFVPKRERFREMAEGTERCDA